MCPLITLPRAFRGCSGAPLFSSAAPSGGVYDFEQGCRRERRAEMRKIEPDFQTRSWISFFTMGYANIRHSELLRSSPRHPGSSRAGKNTIRSDRPNHALDITRGTANIRPRFKLATTRRHDPRAHLFRRLGGPYSR